MEVYNMKLNNLSRLTALLMAIMMLAMASAMAEDAGIDLDDLTGGYLSELEQTTALIDTLTEAGYCATCAKDVASAGLTEWPMIGYDCLYKHLAELTPSEAYDMLIGYDNADTAEGDALYEAYINAHNNHVYNAQIAGSSDYPAVICDGCSYLVLQPGVEGHDENCPWHDEEYTPGVSTDVDVSTPEALKNAIEQGATTIKLTFGVAGEGATYVWQTSTNPDAENAAWTDISGATSSTYDLSITPAAVGQAYRCVATAADGTKTTSATFYLGGEVFFTWAINAADVAAWLALEGNKMEYVLAAYAASLKGIALAEVIHVTTLQTTAEDGSTVAALCLLELHGLTTLAEIDADGNVIDTRYHIAVATYNATTGTITALGN